MKALPSWKSSPVPQVWDTGVLDMSVPLSNNTYDSGFHCHPTLYEEAGDGIHPAVALALGPRKSSCLSTPVSYPKDPQSPFWSFWGKGLRRTPRTDEYLMWLQKDMAECNRGTTRQWVRTLPQLHCTGQKMQPTFLCNGEECVLISYTPHTH